MGQTGGPDRWARQGEGLVVREREGQVGGQVGGNWGTGVSVYVQQRLLKYPTVQLAE